MAFTTEDGTIVAGANSYVTVAYADTYHDDRGNTAWTGTDAVKQAALIKATDYVDQNYDFNGYIYDEDQALNWPRSIINADTDEIPDKLKQAVCLLALEALSEDLNPTLGRNVKREKVDVIEVEYQDGASMSKSRPAIYGLLKSYVSGGKYNVKVTRV